MLAMGLKLTPLAILGPLRSRRLVLVALALNFFVAPGVAWILTLVIPLEKGHAIGLLLLGGAAGAPFLPKVVEIARGSLVISAALMGLLTIGTAIFLPFALPFLIPGLTASPWDVARPLIVLMLGPLVLGMLIKSRAGTLADRVTPVLDWIGTASLVLLSILMVALNARALVDVIGSGAIFTAIVYFVAIYYLGRWLGDSTPEAGNILALATTARNFGAALAVSGSFKDPNVNVMIIVGATVCIIVSFVAATVLRRSGICTPGPS
jgi:BASS family bile acid:Na+ symporter